MNPRTHRVGSILILCLLVTFAGVARADYDQAMHNYKTGKFVEAAGQFQELVDQSPNYDYGFFMLGMSFLQMKKYKDAEGNFLKAIELNGDRFAYHYGLAQSYFYRNQFDKTIAALKTAEGLATDDATQLTLYKLRGYAYERLEKWPDAIGEFEKAQKIESSPRVTVALANGYYKLGHTDKAVPLMREALKTNPDDEAMLQGLAAALINNAAEERDETRKVRIYDEARQTALKLQQLDSQSAEANNLLGRAALGAKQYAAAEQSFRKVLALDSDHCYAMANLGKVYIAQEKWGDAEAVLRDAAVCAPRMAVVFENLGYALAKQNDLDEAVKYYQMALDIKPSDATRQMMKTAQRNIEIAKQNAEMDRIEKQQNEEERKAHEEYEKELAKQVEWEKRRARDSDN